MKKGLSMIVSAVILILLVIVIGIIIFPWLKGITGQIIMLEGKNIALVCEDVRFQASYSSGILYIANTGNIQIHDIKALISKEKSYETMNTNEFVENWPTNGLNIGEAFSSPANFDLDVQKVKILPTLMGKTNNGKEETYICGEKYGEEIILD